MRRLGHPIQDDSEFYPKEFRKMTRRMFENERVWTMARPVGQDIFSATRRFFYLR